MIILNFLSQIIGWLSAKRGYLGRVVRLSSRHLGREVELRIYRPAVAPNRKLKLLICLDGQDFERMDMKTRLERAANQYPNKPFLLVGIVAGDRLREYATAGRLDYQGRGDQSRAHQDFISEELMPWLKIRYRLPKTPDERGIIGFSLGGLHAFDFGWRRSDIFGSVGVFSGALWWRSKPFLKKKPDANRIVHDYVSRTIEVPNDLRIWLMAGTEDEKDDRNNNGIIDAIDDTIQLEALLKKRGFDSAERLTYYEKAGGRHDPETWGEVFPVFLAWWLRE